MYTGLCNCLVAEGSFRWTRSQMLAIVNGAGIPLLIALMVSFNFYYVIGVVGIILCAFWFRANYRSQERIDFWRECLAGMEPAQSLLLVYRVFTSAKWKDLSKPPLVPAVNALPYIFLVIWLGVLAIAISSDLQTLFFTLFRERTLS